MLFYTPSIIYQVSSFFFFFYKKFGYLKIRTYSSLWLVKYKNKEIQDFYSYKCVDVLFVGPNGKVDKLENVPLPTIYIFHFRTFHVGKQMF